MSLSTESEFGTIEAIELKRLTRRGAMQPLLCRGSDGAHYILKPFSWDRSWPLVVEWVCARLGRSVNLPIPNYRQVVVTEELAEEWNAFNPRKIEPGVGFGSQQVASAVEFEPSLTPSIPEALRLRVLAFDWWIRNFDRGEKNPNLLWRAETRTMHVIDHDQAGQMNNAALFWETHLFRTSAPPEVPWFPPDLQREFAVALAKLLPSPLIAELPSTWTTDPGAVTWLIRTLNQSLQDASHRDWRNHD